MNRPTTKQIIEWLQEQLGDCGPSVDRDNGLWIVDRYAFGNTEHGFSSDYSLNYDVLEAEMDEWIATEFPVTAGRRP